MAALEVDILPALSDNYVYLLHEPSSGTTGVVDPAVAAPVLERLDDRDLSLDWILITHHHPDHTGGIRELKATTGCRAAGPAAEAATIPGLDRELVEGDRFVLGGSEAVVLETPGHTAGHISYSFEEAGALFCADVLFSLGCGRVFEGTAEQMWSSLCKFDRLPDETHVYCGHEYTLANARFALTVDPDNEALKRRAREAERLRKQGEPTLPTTLGVERAANPFLRPHDARIRARLGIGDVTDAEVFGELRRRKDDFAP